MTDLDCVNIAAGLPAMARLQPDALAVACPRGRDRAGSTLYTRSSFRQLDELSDDRARELDARGIRRGMRTVLMVPPGLDFFVHTFALFKMGAVPVLIDPGMGIKNLGRCLAEAEPEAFLGIPRAQLARRLSGWGRKTIRIALTVKSGRNPQASPSTRAVLAPTRPEETAAILFTSGSTGAPKGAVYTHANFAAQVEILRDLYGIESGEVDLCTFPLFALFAPALGMSAVVPEMDATRPAQVDPTKIISAIQAFNVTNLFGSPALIDRVGRYGVEHGARLPTLRRVISAGAPVSARVLERFATLLNGPAQIFTPYGATEALPVASIGSAEILGATRAQTDRGAGVCVGRPVAGMRVAVIRISDAPVPVWSDDLRVPVGEIGEIVVSGPVVTREYHQRPEATALAKIADPAQGDGGFWHRMGDVGRWDDQGRLWFCGRKAHRVVTTSGTLFTIPCEAVFNTHPRVSRTALVGVGARGALRPVLCVELDRGQRRSDRRRLPDELRELGSRHEHTREIQTILFHPAFPVDVRHNAKIFREQLAVWAARKLR